MAVNSFREDEEQKQVLNRDTLLRLYRYLLFYKKQVGVVLFIMFVTVTISMLNPLIIERAINVHIEQKDVRGLIMLGIAALILNIVFVVGTKLRMVLIAKVANRVVLKIREELYIHIQSLGFYFFDSRPTGKILARVIGDVNSLKDVLSDSVTTLIPDLCTIVGVMIIMLVKNWKLAMAAVITLPFMTVGMYLVQRASHKRWQLVRKKSSNLNAFVHEELAGIRIVQSFCAEKESMNDFQILVKEHVNAFVDAVRYADLFGSVIELSWGAGGFLLYYIGIQVIGVGTIEVGTFLAFATYLGMFWSPLRNLSNFYNKMVTNISAAERVFDILDTEPELKNAEDARELPVLSGKVEFQNVSFAYQDEPDVKILNHINVCIQPGEMIALVGPTGAGKTTFVNLISRFYDTTSGAILLDGFDIKNSTIESLRQQMGIMTQENFLFSGTIKENIRYGRLDATDEEVVAAAKAVNAHEFIMKMPEGYETKITERGGGLSAGQRQLLAFARTMVSQPSILILDEATSSIDTQTELLVQKGIEALLKGRTSFVIAHRLSTIKKADRIFVIDRGMIVEEGNHEQLMAKKGEYYQLYQAQFHK
ncbi:Putative multidrug export ATP-binding/permease protein [Clostridiales bacterium CHKCI001]|nr:Putative multidrug export ATP-binding/permease protein [Clostridiales bacterium CHKCI001]